jgi:hypothetical protein
MGQGCVSYKSPVTEGKDHTIDTMVTSILAGFSAQLYVTVTCQEGI